jgi:adenosine deaminase
MMNRLRTALVSVTAVAVAMMVLGSNARAKSVPSASQRYVVVLTRLAQVEIRNGISLLQRYSSLQSTVNRLDSLSMAAAPNSRLVATIDVRIAAVSNRAATVYAGIQNNANFVEATTTALKTVAPLAVPPLPPRAQARVAFTVSSGQILVGVERGVATPIR